jgi:hypothetical protein
MTHWLGPLDVFRPGPYGNTIEKNHFIKASPVTGHRPCCLFELTFLMPPQAASQICPIVMKIGEDKLEDVFDTL